MCGITGFLSSNQENAEEKGDIIGRMARTMEHRGPDDQGTWLDESGTVALGHRRLSIIDLSLDGHQPMQSSCGRFVIAFNGEIYNFKEMRKELESTGHNFRSSSDTEVILESVAAWGIDAAVRRFVGMFAFALWDKREKTLYLVRDRLGIKPLYYGWQGSTFLFGSELKSLRAHPDFAAPVSSESAGLYMNYCYIPAPHSIYKNIWKLEAGCILKVRPGNMPEDFSPFAEEKTTAEPTTGRPARFWSARQCCEAGAANPFSGSEEEATLELEKLLSTAVGDRMVSDVPLGAFLSGGIDSSLAVALMQAQSSDKVRTFTIGSHSELFNEAEYAKDVADHLQTQHTELYVSDTDAMNLVPELAHFYDEPFADSSQIPTTILCKLTRQHVTVALSGDGGDELFGGYRRYFQAPAIWNPVKFCPRFLRILIAGAMRGSAPAADVLYRVTGGKLWPSFLRTRPPGDILEKVARIIDAKSEKDLYRRLVSISLDVMQEHAPQTYFDMPERQFGEKGFVRWMMHLDSITYMPDDILVKVDRASMAASLEARVPLIDHRVYEFAAKLPMEWLIRNGKGKTILRNILYKHVPEKLIDRPKTGFGIPLGDWLRTGLRDWADALLTEEALNRSGIFDTALVRRRWLEHSTKKRDWKYWLWNVLMFQAWAEKNK